jgi:RNA polymerase sigma-70 factor (ECF subfamily)
MTAGIRALDGIGAAGASRVDEALSEDFAELYRSHYRRVLGLCLRLLGRRAQAEEAAQEVFVKAYRAMDRYDPAQPFAAWILRIASNHCIDLIRRRAREPLGFDDADADVEAAAGPEDGGEAALTGAQDAEAVRAAVDALPERYRLPVVLAYFEEASYDEIAERLGITRNHVGVLLLRARRALRAALMERELESTS